jgi:hypothetical protein
MFIVYLLVIMAIPAKAADAQVKRITAKYLPPDPSVLELDSEETKSYGKYARRFVDRIHELNVTYNKLGKSCELVVRPALVMLSRDNSFPAIAVTRECSPKAIPNPNVFSFPIKGSELANAASDASEATAQLFK